jgi:hypothetical protein
MNIVNFESIQRKILSTSYTLGVCGGLYLSAMKSFKVIVSYSGVNSKKSMGI